MDRLLQGERVSVGGWAGRRDDRVVMVAVAGERSVAMPPIKIVPDTDGRFVVHGSVQVPADHVGWDVPGTIRGGDFVAASSPTSDAGHWLADMREQPMGRETLLNPDAQGLAAGVIVNGEVPILASLITTYSFFEGFDHSAAATRVLHRLQAFRQWCREPPAIFGPIPSSAEVRFDVSDN